MSALSIQPTYPIFTDIDGQPLEDGYVWIGAANLDPQTNPINVYWDAALTLPAAQPIRTLAGYPANSGTPARLYVNSDYSIRVMNKNGSVVYSASAATERYNDVVISGVNAEDVIYDPPFIGAVQTNVEAKLAQTVSVKDFGAVGDDTVDDSVAIQAALNSGATGIYVPNGTYKLLSTLNVPEGVSIFGSGANAIFKPRTVNCFLLQASSYIGNVQFSNFTVLGDTANQYAFKYESLAAGNRVTGVLFQNLTTGNIKPGYFNGLWHSTFRSCTFYGCYTGIQFVGQNVKCLIDDCRILKGGTGVGDSTGVYINGAISPIVTGSYKRGEDIQIRNTLIFGFDIAVDAVDVMYFAVTRSDLDYVQKVGVQITQADATCNVIGNWIAIDAATTSPFQGVSFVALGSPRTSQAKVAENVCIGIAGALQSEGVYVGGNQLGVVVDSNELRGFKYGVSLNGGAKARVVNNTFVNSVTYDVFMFATVGNYFAGNNFSGSVYRNPTQVGPNQYGENLGYLTRASGSIPVGSGQITATVSLVSLGLPSGNPTTSRVTYAVSCMPDVDRGAINAACDGTNVTFTAATPYGPASSLAFTVQAIDN